MAYATASDLTTFLSIDSSTDNTLLTALIARAQAWLERETGRVFEAAADSTKYFDAVEDVAEDDAGRLTLLLLRQYTLAAITTVTNGDGTVIAANQYVTEPRDTGPYWGIRIKANQSVYWTYSDTPENAIAITGKWAYAVAPPADIVQATIDLTAYLYRRRGVEGAGLDRVMVSPSGVTIAPPGFPQTVISTVQFYQRRGR